jgi:hypothetical protein
MAAPTAPLRMGAPVPLRDDVFKRRRTTAAPRPSRKPAARPAASAKRPASVTLPASALKGVVLAEATPEPEPPVPRDAFAADFAVYARHIEAGAATAGMNVMLLAVRPGTTDLMLYASATARAALTTPTLRAAADALAATLPPVHAYSLPYTGELVAQPAMDGGKSAFLACGHSVLETQPLAVRLRADVLRAEPAPPPPPYDGSAASWPLLQARCAFPYMELDDSP